MEQVGRFNVDRPYADDWDYAIRMSRHYQFRKLRQVVALYRVHPGQSSKQVMRVNPADELRSRTIAQYGYCGPDGSEVDHRKLRQRISRDRLNFGLRHYDAGSWDIAARSFAGAIRARPPNVRAVTFLLASMLKWATAATGVIRSK